MLGSARFWTERKTKYSRATLETLALIAYRQPITRGEIEQIRGVAVNSNILTHWKNANGFGVVGHRDAPGKPALFGTTKAFLDYFGLKRLDELPPLSDLKDIGELEPQLPLHNNHRHTAQLQIQTDQDSPNSQQINIRHNSPISGISPQPTQEVNTECCSSTQSNRPDNNRP